MNETTKQITVAVIASAAAAATAALITHYLTKQATIDSVAKGTTPLPPGSTPTTSTPAAAPAGSAIAPGTKLATVQDAHAYAPDQTNPNEQLLRQAVAVSGALRT